MYLLYYVAIGTVKKRVRRKRWDMSLLNYAAIGTVKREKRKNRYWYSSIGRGVRSSGCDYCVYSNSFFFFVCVLEESESLISVRGDLSRRAAMVFFF